MSNIEPDLSKLIERELNEAADRIATAIAKRYVIEDRLSGLSPDIDSEQRGGARSALGPKPLLNATEAVNSSECQTQLSAYCGPLEI